MDAGKFRPQAIAEGGPERWLSLAGAILIPLGLLVVLLGWYGAASTGALFEQVPYLISGGLLGVALALIGGFLFFGSWLARLVAESRRQSELIARLLEGGAGLGSGLGAAPGADRSAAAVAGVAALARGASAEPEIVVVRHDDTQPIGVSLVATANGTMAHTPTCPVVAKRPNLRPVKAGSAFQRCKICAV